jgi:hypothetical protein
MDGNNQTIDPASTNLTHSLGIFFLLLALTPGLCKLFEQKLKNMNPHQRNITYDVSELFAYIDGLGDLGILL